MKKYILVLIAMSLIEWPAGWQNAARPEIQQCRITNIVEIRTAEGPAYLVSVETTDSIASCSASVNSEYKQQKAQISGFNLFPEPVTIALLALAGYSFGGRRRKF